MLIICRLILDLSCASGFPLKFPSVTFFPPTVGKHANFGIYERNRWTRLQNAPESTRAHVPIQLRFVAGFRVSVGGLASPKFLTVTSN